MVSVTPLDDSNRQHIESSATSAAPGLQRPLALVLLVAIPLGNGVSVFDVVAVSLLPLVIMWHWRRSSRTLVALLALYVLAQVLSDLVNRAPFSSTIAEFVILGVFALPAVTVPWLVAEDTRRWQQLTVLAMLGLAMIGLLYLSVLDVRELWKFGLGAPLLIAATIPMGLLWARGHRLVVPVIVTLIALTSLYLGFRSLAAEALLSAAALLGLVFWRPTPRSLAALFALTIPVLLGIQSAYIWAADSGNLGREEQVRYQRQATTDGGLLLTSRPEVEISLMLIPRRPVLGYGSDPRLTDRDKVDGRDQLRELKIGFTDYIRQRMLGEFQAHSLFFTSWIRAGFLGALAVAGMWWWVASRSTLLLLDRSLDTRFLPFFVCALPTLTWEFLFSPSSVGAGIIYGLLVSVILIHDLQRRRRQDDPRQPS